MALLLPPDEAHLWYVVSERIGCSHLIKKYQSLMTPEEHARYDKFRSCSAQFSFLITRALVRTVLSQYHDTEPQAWTFDVGAYGKPEIKTPIDAVGLNFNLANTDGLVACAVTINRHIGVDAEAIDRPVEGADIADRFFSPAEAAALRLLPIEEQREAFFAYWTLKEAYIKARGLGLSLALDKFAFRLPRGGPAAITIDPSLGDTPSRWRFFQVRPTDRHLIAVAVSQDGRPRDPGTPLTPLKLVVKSIVP